MLIHSGVDVDGKANILKSLRPDSELLLIKSTSSCFDIICFAFTEIDCTELLVLLVYVKDLFKPATAGTKSFIFDFAL